MKIVLKFMDGKSKTYNIPWQEFAIIKNEWDELGIIKATVTFPEGDHDDFK